MTLMLELLQHSPEAKAESLGKLVAKQQQVIAEHEARSKGVLKIVKKA